MAAKKERVKRKGGKQLVVVESPAKARTIGKYLGRGYDVKATVGHVRDLPKRELGVDVEHGFTPKYVTIKEKSKTLTEIKKAAKTAARVLIATDPDREGEAIAWHVAEQIGDGDRVRRVLFHEITKDGVAQGLANPLDIDQRKVDAQQARRILDRLVGYKASPLLWKSIKTGLSAGRVQTVALRLICEREEEIRKFVPREYWTIEAELEKDGPAFQARLHKLDGHKPEIRTADVAEALVGEIRKLPFVVTQLSKKERRRNAPAPFTTSTLQQEAAKQLGFSARRTMRAAQALYEGVELGDEGPVGLITYMRTDSTRVADGAITQARDYIREQFDRRYLPDTPNAHRGKGGSRVQDAHEAVRPTDVTRRPEALKRRLPPDLFKLYQLIWRRFLASQMTPEVYELTTVDFDLGRFLFRATGSRVLFDGYRVLYHEGHETEEGKSPDELGPIPALAEGDRVTVRAITPSQHFTEPPPRYSEASLVKKLEELGIGRPSTYASIISTLRDRWYATTKDRRFAPTPQGEVVWSVMRRCFPEVFEVGFTAQMETELDKVEEGDLGWQRVLEDFWGPFSRQLAAVNVEAIIHDVHDLSELHKEKCPECGSGLVVKSGRFGPYIACERYPDGCSFSRSLKKNKVPDRPTDETCPKCGAPLVIKTGRYGEFMACTQYPKCKHTQPVPLGIKCPKCGEGDIAERRTRRGRNFWGCLRYPDCDYSTWTQPVAVACPACGFVGMEQRQTKAAGVTRKCMKCGHEASVDEPSPTEPVTA
ncbi:MAG: type I DNA topoisomerase [Gemmatimonadales bacterium]